MEESGELGVLEEQAVSAQQGTAMSVARRRNDMHHMYHCWRVIMNNEGRE